jgi:hypothetical protein
LKTLETMQGQFEQAPAINAKLKEFDAAVSNEPVGA